MADKIVIGDLGEYRGDDCLTFASGASVVTPSNGTIIDKLITADILYKSGLGNRYIADFSPAGEGGWIFRVEDNRLRFTVFQSDGQVLNVYYNPLVDGTTYCIEAIALSSGTLNLTVNGSMSQAAFDGTNKIPTTGTVVVGNAVEGLTENLDSQLLGIRIDGEFNYNLNGQFGNVSVLDSSGNGNDGTINGATWWKKEIAENYLTTTAYLNARPAVQEVAQEIIVVDPSQYYPTDDVIWAPYNTDPTFSFIVYLQQNMLQGRTRMMHSHLLLNL